jgi:broad specificity phosphatase PhoE
MDRLFVARHAESEFNVRGIVSAMPGGPGSLTADGRRQAQRLGEAVGVEAIDVCVTSRSVPHEEWADFDDPAAGVFEGQTVEAFNSWLRTASKEMAPAGGESQAQALARHLRGYRALLERPEPVVFAVIHRLGVGWLLAGLDGGRFPDVSYAQVHELSVDEVVKAVTRLESEPLPTVPY